MAQVSGDDGVASGFTPTDPFGVWGDSGSPGPFGKGGNGVVGSSKLYTGVAGFSQAEQSRAAGVFGLAPRVGVAGGVSGSTTAPGGKVGVYGTGSNGNALGGVGVVGESDTADGVVGESRSGAGVLGLTGTGPGVIGVSSQNTGLFGISNGTGILAVGGSMAAELIGDVDVTGTLTKGGGGFLIDHPIAPAERYLRHSFVESPDMKNIYDGVATCDDRGEATIELPLWFEALNEDFCYQLTPLGHAAPNLHVASEIKGNRFTIAGGHPLQRVCWQATGIRRDPWARAHRLVVDEPKPDHERGRYRHPEAHGQSDHMAIRHERLAAAREQLAQSSRRAHQSEVD